MTKLSTFIINNVVYSAKAWWITKLSTLYIINNVVYSTKACWMTKLSTLIINKVVYSAKAWWMTKFSTLIINKVVYSAKATMAKMSHVACLMSIHPLPMCDVGALESIKDTFWGKCVFYDHGDTIIWARWISCHHSCSYLNKTFEAGQH